MNRERIDMVWPAGPLGRPGPLAVTPLPPLSASLLVHRQLAYVEQVNFASNLPLQIFSSKKIETNACRVVQLGATKTVNAISIEDLIVFVDKRL